MKLPPKPKNSWNSAVGVQHGALRAFIRGLFRYIKEYRIIHKLAPLEWPCRMSYPCLQDSKANAGSAAGHYFHQDFLVAQRIFRDNPVRHIDIGSRIDGFVAHVATFRPLEIIDIRPMTDIHNVTMLQMDIVNPIVPCTPITDSLSSLHVVEHFGLGRYGDPIDINAVLVLIICVQCYCPKVDFISQLLSAFKELNLMHTEFLRLAQFSSKLGRIICMLPSSRMLMTAELYTRKCL